MKFLGLLVVQKILQSAFKRNKIPEENRVPFYMYVDEFQNFISKEFESILSEARKYRLALFVANQYLKQLEDGNDTSVRDAVLGNVGTIVAFRVGSEDGEILERQF